MPPICNCFLRACKVLRLRVKQMAADNASARLSKLKKRTVMSSMSKENFLSAELKSIQQALYCESQKKHPNLLESREETLEALVNINQILTN